MISEKRKARIARVGKVARARIIQVLMVFVVVGNCQRMEKDAVVPKHMLSKAQILWKHGVTSPCQVWLSHRIESTFNHSGALTCPALIA